MNVDGCRWVNVHGSSDPRGTVSFIETGVDLDFAIRRAFWIHGVPVGQPRGHHAHREVRLAMIAVAGAADLILDDGKVRETVRLDRPDRAMLVEPRVWHELADFAAATSCWSWHRAITPRPTTSVTMRRSSVR